MSETVKLLAADLKQTEIVNDVGTTIKHIFDKQTKDAVNAALAINRPLLIWGEPGIGKSQLAKAVAQELNRVFIPFVADAQTESRDLLWHFDAIARLAEAQIQNANNIDKDALAMQKFIVPQALWWALNWKNAEQLVTTGKDSDDNSLYRYQPPAYTGECHPKNGAVVLIDEIDKADTSVPNGLLQALGANRFHPQGLDRAVEAEGVPPLVIITTNDSHQLPDAFLRRCLSLHLSFPDDAEKQCAFLVQRGEVNFPELKQSIVGLPDNAAEDNILTLAAKLLITDRQYAETNQLYPLCGQAEYFDLLRGIETLNAQKRGTLVELMQCVREYTFQKHPDFPRADRA
ncbi:MAG: hypothetical protein methR_P3383 [Methyloprofundus sp.]|nr:MAG: hypothetical protein methR_P3383 [Methyloprofundus sp.]